MIKAALSLALLMSSMLAAGGAWGATITIQNDDVAGMGFNDATAAAPVGGNSGTTRGAQALKSFQYAANLIGSLIYSDVEIIVAARFAPIPPLDCSDTSAVLGGASPQWVCVTDLVHDHPNVAMWYPGALCNRLAGVADGNQPVDITADFNGRVGQSGCLSAQSWYFGFDANGGANTIDLATVVLHELSHGLGFLTYASVTGAPLDGTLDVFMAFTYDNSQGRYWYQMTNAQRAASGKNLQGVVWAGPRTVPAAMSYLSAGKDPAGRPQLYTPSIYAVGSSVSHLSTTASPNALMEPVIHDDLDPVANGIDITLQALQDIGWRAPGCSNGILEAGEECDDGANNSDTVANACRTACHSPVCGDAVTDNGEECDDGGQNSNAPGHCRVGCLSYYCGDGIVDPGEPCDSGGSNANTPNQCRTNCQNPSCGDDVVDTGEQCDDGVLNKNYRDYCRTDCKTPICGDGIKNTGEACDDGNQASGDTCSPNCQVFTPGDAGTIVAGGGAPGTGAAGGNAGSSSSGGSGPGAAGAGIGGGAAASSAMAGSAGQSLVADSGGAVIAQELDSSVSQGEILDASSLPNASGSHTAAAMAPATAAAEAKGACGCRTTGSGSGAPPLLLLLIGGFALRKRRNDRAILSADNVC